MSKAELRAQLVEQIIDLRNKLRDSDGLEVGATYYYVSVDITGSPVICGTTWEDSVDDFARYRDWGNVFTDRDSAQRKLDGIVNDARVSTLHAARTPHKAGESGEYYYFCIEKGHVTGGNPGPSRADAERDNMYPTEAAAKAALTALLQSNKERRYAELYPKRLKQVLIDNKVLVE